MLILVPLESNDKQAILSFCLEALLPSCIKIFPENGFCLQTALIQVMESKSKQNISGKGAEKNLNQHTGISAPLNFISPPNTYINITRRPGTLCPYTPVTHLSDSF